MCENETLEIQWHAQNNSIDVFLFFLYSFIQWSLRVLTFSNNLKNIYLDNRHSSYDNLKITIHVSFDRKKRNTNYSKVLAEFCFPISIGVFLQFLSPYWEIILKLGKILIPTLMMLAFYFALK